MQALDRKAEIVRDKLDVQAKDARSSADEEIQHAQWVAGSVLEGSQTHLTNQLKSQERQTQTWANEIEVATTEAKKRLNNYPKSMRPWPEIDPASLASPKHTTIETAQAGFESDWALAMEAYQQMRSQSVAALFAGLRPYLIGLFALASGTIAGPVLRSQQPSTEITEVQAAFVALVASFAVIVLFAWALFVMGKHYLKKDVVESATALAQAEKSLDYYKQLAIHLHDKNLTEAQDKYKQALQETKEKFAPLLNELNSKRHDAMSKLKSDHSSKREKLRENQTAALITFETDQAAEIDRLSKRCDRRKEVTQARLERDRNRLVEYLSTGQTSLNQRWETGRTQILRALNEANELQTTSNAPWSSSHWNDWQPPSAPAPAARFGELAIEPDMTDSSVSRFDLGLNQDQAVPAILAGPGHRSLLIQTGPEGRDAALDTLRSAMVRLLTTLPPGQVKFTLIDPVGLGETFAGFMHLVDYDDSLVNGRIWSEPAQIDHRLLDLTDHLSNVIQKHLRNEFDTIDAYNEQAGELAEPYRFVVVADYPHGLSSSSISRLNAIAQSGPRCGVFILAMQDVRQKLPPDVDDDLAARCATIRHTEIENEAHEIIDRKFIWQDEVFEQFDLTLDAPPQEGQLSELVNKVGEASIDATRVQVPFATITPNRDELWTRSSADDLTVPIGRSGATRLQSIAFGKGVAQHALIAGKTGSGKSSLLHALVTNMCLWYSPDELEVYLIDFKKGVEFKPYVTHQLPHARAIAIESDRAFGLSILKKLDQQMDERGELFRKVGAQNIAGFRSKQPDTPMPRTLLIVDEFQELFAADDDIAQQSSILLDRLVRQGRAFGMHALMGSQSLSGAAGLAMGTMSQMAIRIALMCGEADSQLILGDDNTAARLLSRPGEAIYNEKSGDPTANDFFQVAWLPELTHEDQLKRVREKFVGSDHEELPCAVFEGSAPAHLETNRSVKQALRQWPAAEAPHTPKAYIGEPVAISDAAAFELPRFAGANGLIVGQQADAALNLTATAIVSLAAQYAKDGARFVIFNGSPEAEHDQRFDQLSAALPHDITRVGWRDTGSAISDLYNNLQDRLANDDEAAPVYIAAFGLHRLRDLKKQEDEFSFSLDDDSNSSDSMKPDKQFAELLREGPGVGIHVIAWCDRAAAVEQVLDRRDIRSFDQRVLFQMSASDSAQLIDTPDANELGTFRALLYRDDRGTMQVFRPYDWPDLSALRFQT